MTLHPLFWAVGQTPATASQKMCLIAIASQADPSGHSAVPMADIQKISLLSPREIRRSLRELEARGIVTVENRVGENGMSLSNSYRLNLPEEFKVAEQNTTHRGTTNQPKKARRGDGGTPGEGGNTPGVGVAVCQGGDGSTPGGDGSTPPLYNIYTSRKKLLPGTATMTGPGTDTRTDTKTGPGTVLCKSSVRVVIQDSEREGGEPPHTPRGSDDCRGKNENREIVWEGASCRLNRRDYDNLRANCTALATMDDTAFRRELNIADSLVMQQDKPPSSRFWALRALMLKRDSWAPKPSPKARPEKGSPEWMELRAYLMANDPLFVGKIHECDWVKWERMKEARRKKAVA